MSERTAFTIGDLLEAAGLDLDTELVIGSDRELNQIRACNDAENVIINTDDDESDLQIVAYVTDDGEFEYVCDDEAERPESDKQQKAILLS